MKRLRLVLLTLAIPLLAVGQIDYAGSTTSLGGGSASGDTWKTTYIAGEAGASAEIAAGRPHTIYPGFIPGKYIILSFGLKKDSTVLAIVYEATAGNKWKNRDGWLSSSDIDEWVGVTVTDQRVTGLDLSANNLQNGLPNAINLLSKLQSLDVSNNELRRIPDMTGLNLTSLNVERNRLGFDDLIANKNFGGSYDYSPQRRYGITRNDTVPAGGSRTLLATIPGTNNKFQWIFDAFGNGPDSVVIDGATNQRLVVSDINYDDMGSYRLVATNDSLPGLQIQTRNINLWATTTVQGTVYADDQGTLLDDGLIGVFRITKGPYTLTDSSKISAQGQYAIEDLVLGDFILKARANPSKWPNVIQTYYVSTADWKDADTLVVREAIDNVDINMVFKPDHTPDPIGATITGTIESAIELDSVDEEGRVLARRKVKKAGCSMRRRTRGGGGRLEEDEYELYAYVESDDEGVFDFTGIPEGDYLLNIQYPGIPMDETSDIEFVIGGDKQEQKFEALAIITEAGISVDAYEVLFVPKPYLKDVILYPNPTADAMAVDFTVNRRINSLKLQIISLTGAKLEERTLDHRMGAKKLTIDFAKYESGNYFLLFTDEAGTFRHQVKVRKL